MRFFSILAAFLAISLSLLFINRQTIAEKLLTNRIEAIGCQKVQLTVSEVSSSKLTVTSLAATFQKNSAVQHIQLENVVLNFSPAKLLIGKITGMSIDVLQIDLKKQEKKSRKIFSYQTIQDLFDTNPLPPYLPENIFIHSLILSGPGAAPLTGESLQLETQILDSGLSVKLLLPTKKINIDAVLTRLTNNATHLQVDGHQAAAPLFHLSLQQKHAETTGKFTILLDTLNMLPPLLPVSLPDVSGKLELQFSVRNTPTKPLLMELLIDGQDLILPGLTIDSLTGKLSIHSDDFKTLTFHRGSHIYVCDIQSPAANLKKLYFQISGTLAREKKELALSLGHDSRLLLEELTTKTLRVEYAEITPDLNISHSPQGMTFVMHPKFTAAIKKLHANELNVSELHISPEETIAFSLRNQPTASWNIGAGTIMVDINTLQLQDLRVHPTRLTLEILDPKTTLSPLPFHGLIHNRAVSVRWKNKSVSLKDIELDLAADQRNMQLNIAFSHATIPGRIEGTATHDLQINTGKAQFSTVHALDLQVKHAEQNQLITGLHLPFSINSGLVDSTVTMQWVMGEPLVVTSSFQLSDGMGEYKNISLSGVQIQQDLQLLPQLRTLVPGTILIDAITTGFNVKNIAVSNQLTPTSDSSLPIVLVDSIDAELLGGRVSSKNINYNPSHPETDFIVQVDGVKLEDIINLNKMEDLSVTGILDGNISIHTKGPKIYAAKGKLQSRAPGGVIKYQPIGGNNALQQLPQYAIHALEEFHYNTLSATPLYEHDGTLTIKIHTEGRSPKVNTNRPIHLNLNTSQNLLSLLQSLSYTRNLTDDLEKRLKTYQLKN